MRFTDYSFGSVRVDGVTYDHDLIIDRGKIRERRKVDLVALPTAQAIGVLGGTLPETVLGTYQTEREPHARSLIRLAKLAGTAMTSGGELGNLLRGVVAPRLHLVPGLKEQILSGQTRPCTGPARCCGRGCAAPSRAGWAPIRSWTAAAVSTTWTRAGSR